jgi:hypothetical protein
MADGPDRFDRIIDACRFLAPKNLGRSFPPVEDVLPGREWSRQGFEGAVGGG